MSSDIYSSKIFHQLIYHYSLVVRNVENFDSCVVKNYVQSDMEVDNESSSWMAQVS